MPDETPSEEDDAARIIADEAHLGEVQEQIDHAREVHEEAKSSPQGGVWPGVEDEEGTAAAGDLQT